MTNNAADAAWICVSRDCNWLIATLILTIETAWHFVQRLEIVSNKCLE